MVRSQDRLAVAGFVLLLHADPFGDRLRKLRIN